MASFPSFKRGEAQPSQRLAIVVVCAFRVPFPVVFTRQVTLRRAHMCSIYCPILRLPASPILLPRVVLTSNDLHQRKIFSSKEGNQYSVQKKIFLRKKKRYTKDWSIEKKFLLTYTHAKKSSIPAEIGFEKQDPFVLQTEIWDRFFLVLKPGPTS